MLDSSTSPAQFSYSFPAIRGVQASREFFVSMCPLRLLPKLFQFDDEELQPELRAQRTLNKARVPEIARYIVENASSYTFSAITASIDGDVQFTPTSKDSDTASRIGTLTVSMDSRFIINDGQHRRAAIEAALQQAPELGDETIAVVFFVDRGLQRCQQMFADLNRHAVKPSASLGVLYDHRNATGKVAKHLSLTSPVFKNLVESERSTLSARSRKLFTLSALHFATQELLPEKQAEDFPMATQRSQEFWEAVCEQIPEWLYVRESKMTAGEVRKDFIHCHAIVLQALGRAGRSLYEQYPGEVKKRLQRLRKVDWSRTNAQAWEGRAMVGGAMAKSGQNVTLTANEIKRVLGLKLSPEEQHAETALMAARIPKTKTARS
ncbi:DNA sulfur modification protein DndB [Hydrogenophaga sp. IBVHS2]|uniref:DNA sulfur modification protein DndB n=1 Tax=Hydrogenophaga sp. IBVHS2 TaxID=1985170 RepID=UPI000A2EAFE5|nr:DNA sulfur modification protein DndB [Hydrogenophaga sp. IBVHS2]OSZ63311.1 DNA sulfur modification protein DndB [Hydrogenophaga sp. IBVHS2]